MLLLYTSIYYIFTIILFKCTFCLCKRTEDELDSQLVKHLNDLDKDYEAKYVDPYDMFGEKMQPEVNVDRNLNKYYNSDNKGCECLYEKNGLQDLKKELELCSFQNLEKDIKIQEEVQLNNRLQIKYINANVINVEDFYARILRQFWTLLEMEHISGDPEDVVVIRRLIAKIRITDVTAINNYFQNQKGYQQIDDFFLNAFELNENEETFLLSKINFVTFLEIFKDFKTWMILLWSCFIFLMVWCFALFVIDIQRNMRWNRVLIMMIIILFGISCIVHYRHLVQVKESRRHSYLMQNKGFKDIPDECQSGESWLLSIRRSIFGGASICDQYFQNMMVDSEDEVSPAVVISETASKFVFHPLQHLGISVGLFFSNFYGQIPYVMHLPVSVMFLVMFVIFMISIFGYGITLPFWLGSIKPMNKQSIKADEIKRLIKECEEKMHSNNAKLIEDAREMLLSVSQTTIAVMEKSKSQSERQSLVQISTQAIEKQLERLILDKMSESVVKDVLSPVADIRLETSVEKYQKEKPRDLKVIELRWKEGKDKVDGGLIVSQPNQDFLHQLEDVLEQSLCESIPLSNSDQELDNKESFYEKVEDIMT